MAGGLIGQYWWWSPLILTEERSGKEPVELENMQSPVTAPASQQEVKSSSADKEPEHEQLHADVEPEKPKEADDEVYVA